MLTLKQLFVVSGLKSGAALVQHFGLQPLSISSVIAAYEQQRQAYFVTLTSPNILLSNEVHSFSDLMRLSGGPLGQMDQSEVSALATYLEERGVYLRYVSKDLRRAVIFGDVPSLVSVPAAPVNDGSFIAIRDASSGAAKIGTGTIAFGTVLITFVAAPALAASGETVLIVGAGIVAFGAGWLVGAGLVELLSDDPAPPPKIPSSDNLGLPNEIDDENSGDIEVPDAVAVGSPDNGIDVQGMVDQLADGVFDEIMSTFPIGWDSDSGSPLSGIGDFGGGDDGDDGGFGDGIGFG